MASLLRNSSQEALQFIGDIMRESRIVESVKRDFIKEIELFKSSSRYRYHDFIISLNVPSIDVGLMTDMMKEVSSNEGVDIVGITYTRKYPKINIILIEVELERKKLPPRNPNKRATKISAEKSIERMKEENKRFLRGWLD